MKLAIKGHLTRRKEVLKLLLSLGGKEKPNSNYSYCYEDNLYYINKDGYIDYVSVLNPLAKPTWKIYTLEEFEELYPFKIGDKVCSDNCLFYDDDGLYTISNPFEIISMEWNSALDTITCKIKKYNTILVTTVETIKPYNTMKKEVKKLKDYLKPGYVIEYDDGVRFVITQDVHGNNFGLQIGASIMWDSLGQLDNIVKVYQIDRPGALHKTFTYGTHLTLVWEKPKETELTMQQIADKFGIDVNQLKIKK